MENTSRAADALRQVRLIPDYTEMAAGSVLVECGFLSNPEEERALRDPEYQTRMAAVLAWVCLMDTGAVPS